MAQDQDKDDKIIYRLPPHGSEVKGIDLHIDENTQKLCETYNSSSGTTRSVLYVLMIINIIALIAVFNSNAKYNWTNERVHNYKDSVKKYEDLLINREAAITVHNTAFKKDSIALKDSIDFYSKKTDNLAQSEIADYDIVKVDIIGVNFDIYDMPSIVGISVIVLMIVLRFTLDREMNNLRIAFNSITERYPNDADYQSFKAWLPAAEGEIPAMPDDTDRYPLLTDINFLRRRYHYNYLSMNEVFNVPKLDTSSNLMQKRILGKAINLRLFYFAVAIYSYVMFNFFCNLPSMVRIRPRHTMIIGLICIACYIFVANLSRACSDHKSLTVQVFEDFWNNNYTFDHTKVYRKNYSFLNKALLPLLLLAVLYGASLFYERFM